MTAPGVVLKVDTFGVTPVTNKPITRFTWTTINKMEIQVISYGAIITSIKVPDKYGNVDDIALGFDSIEGYQKNQGAYIGATMGRISNRTIDGLFTLEGTNYTLTKNVDGHHLHGGFKGFDQANWDHHVEGTKVTLSYLSIDGEEGAPGSVITNLNCDVTPDNIFIVSIMSTTTKPTPINLTNHSYFNLAGHDAGAVELNDHVVTINADKYTEATSRFVTTGNLIPVVDTLYDFRTPKQLKELLLKINGGYGYDINYCVNKGDDQGLTFVSRVVHPKSGRAMEVYSDQPGVQWYTSNNLPDPATPMLGKGGRPYAKHGAFCFETQNWPNAINYKNFPNSVLYPGKKYIHHFEYRYTIQN